MLSPVKYFDSVDSKNLATLAMSSGTPSLFAPTFCMAASSFVSHKDLLNLVLINPGQIQLTLIPSSSSSLANILVKATKAVFVMA